MNKLLDVLENLACFPDFGDTEFYVDKIAKESGLSNIEIEAILNRDQGALEGLMEDQHKIICFLVPAKEEEDDNSNDEKEKEDESEEKSQLGAVSF
ncbi:MAG: hypothetical protein OQK04_04265 [Kangiellaceae bacterium]|nr:hypothetical protein [Kangiellaceae bacterium]MCW8997909.1 hypothetical protein [Kangiellaceae bacterium]